MSLLTPNTRIYLTEVKYLPEKREVIAEFSNSSRKLSKKYDFFPSFVTAIEDKNALQEILSMYDSKRFQADYLSEQKAKITAATFSDLKKISKLINSSLNQQVLLLQPERQFLIENNWAYFDSFEEYKGELFKLGNFSFPDIIHESLPDSFVATVNGLIECNKEVAAKLSEKISLSNILCVKLENLLPNNFLFSELFLEKIFFKNSLPLIKEKNSLVEVEFLVEGVYFESFSREWALDFHLNHPKKENRIRQKREWCLSTVPVGPFTRHQREFISAIDSNQLIAKGWVKPVFNPSMVSLQREIESVLSAELLELNKCIASIDSFLSVSDNSDLDLFYLNSFKSCLGSLIGCLPRHMLFSKSRFFFPLLAKSLERAS